MNRMDAKVLHTLKERRMNTRKPDQKSIKPGKEKLFQTGNADSSQVEQYKKDEVARRYAKEPAHTK